MKKHLIIPVLAAIALASCQPKGYKINGETTGSEFADAKVYLTEPINRAWNDLDSATVTDGKFAFSGDAVDSVRVIYLRINPANSDKEMIEPLVFEEGTMRVKVDSTGIKVSGTSQNDALAVYSKEQNEYYERMDTEYKQFMALPDSQKTSEREDTMLNKIMEIERELTKKNLDYSTKAVNTVVGNYIFISTYYNFTTEQKEALFAKMDEKTKSIPRIAALIATTEIEKKTAAGQPYVNFSMPTPAGNTLALADFVGKSDYLLIDFWASWCGPCLRSFPELTAFYTKNKGAKFDIVGVSLDGEKQAWTDAIKKYNLVWHHLSDLKSWACEGAKLYAVNAIPATVLIDKEGKIVGRNMKLDEIQALLNK